MSMRFWDRACLNAIGQTGSRRTKVNATRRLELRQSNTQGQVLHLHAMLDVWLGACLFGKHGAHRRLPTRSTLLLSLRHASCLSVCVRTDKMKRPEVA